MSLISNIYALPPDFNQAVGPSTALPSIPARLPRWGRDSGRAGQAWARLFQAFGLTSLPHPTLPHQGRGEKKGGMPTPLASP